MPERFTARSPRWAKPPYVARGCGQRAVFSVCGRADPSGAACRALPVDPALALLQQTSRYQTASMIFYRDPPGARAAFRALPLLVAPRRIARPVAAIAPRGLGGYGRREDAPAVRADRSARALTASPKRRRSSATAVAASTVAMDDRISLLRDRRRPALAARWRHASTRGDAAPGRVGPVAHDRYARDPRHPFSAPFLSGRAWC